MTFSRMVSATREPTDTEPANSVTEAMRTACFMVRQREEMDVAKELATSLAPGLLVLVRGRRREPALTNVPRIEERKYDGDGEDVGVLAESGHRIPPMPSGRKTQALV